MFYPRIIYDDLKNSFANQQVTVLTGMRRTGKTYLLNQLYNEIPDNKLILDLENRANHEIFDSNDYDQIWKDLLVRYGLNSQKTVYLFLDEVQNLPNLPSIIKYFHDHHDVKFMVTGSSSFYLKNLFSESLSGRKRIFELFPLSFSEFLCFKGYFARLPEIELFGSSKRNPNETLLRFFDEYLSFGGFPSVVLAETADKKQALLKDILYSYIDIDVKKMADFRKINDFENLVRLLVPRIGQKIEITKLSAEAKISRATVLEYLEFLEKTYFISLISPFTKNIGREISKAKKLYFCDTGLANVLAAISSGQQLENTVFNNLKIKYQPKFAFGGINYYQKKNGVEIDFVLGDLAVEVKESGGSFDIKRLEKLSRSLDLKDYYVVCKNVLSENKKLYPATEI